MVNCTKYRIIKKLGSGSFGCVFLHQIVSNGELRAIKEAKEPKHLENLKKEVECLNKCKGFPYVVQMFESKIEDNDGYIVLELALADLNDVMKKPPNKDGLHVDMIIDLIRDITCVLLFFKEKNLVHRDIKANNILVFPTTTTGRRTEYLFKLCDLGGSRETTQAVDGMSSIVGTYTTLHPKIAGRHCEQNAERYTAMEVDQWSFGATLFCVATTRPPFDGLTGINYYERAYNKPKGAICYLNNNYHSVIVNNKYLRWFTNALSKFISELMDAPSYETLQEMSEAFVNSKECEFVVANTSKIITHSELSPCASFSNPTFNELLKISEETPAYILNKQGIQYKTTVSSSDFNVKEPSFVLHQPLLSDLQQPGHNLMKIPQNITTFNDMASTLCEMEQECFDLIAIEECTSFIMKPHLSKLNHKYDSLRAQHDVVKSLVGIKINDTNVTGTANKLEEVKKRLENLIETQTNEKLKSIHSTVQHTMRQFGQPKDISSIQLNNNPYIRQKFNDSCRQHKDFQEKHEENNMKFIEQAKCLIELKALLEKFDEQLKEIMENAARYTLNDEGTIRSQIALEQIQIVDLLKKLNDIVKNNH